MIKVKKLVSKVTIINMYYSFIYPYLTYGSILWGNNYYSPIYDVVKRQNKAIRVINDVPIMDNITPHYVNLSILKFPDIDKIHTCLLFFDLLCDHKPSIPLAIPPLYHSQCLFTTTVYSLLQNKHQKVLSHYYWTLFLE